MQPLVSVIIPTHNRAEFVVEAIRSALDQTYDNQEIIVVDDGSTDHTSELLKQYRDKIHYLYQERAERSKARNRGFEHSKGDYIAFLDSDDIWLPDKVEKQVGILKKKPDVGVVYSEAQFVDIEGVSCIRKIDRDALGRRRPWLYEDLLTTNVVGSPSAVMIRRRYFRDVGMFDESMNTCEDLDLWRRLALRCRFYKIESPLFKLRVHEKNTQSKLSLMAEGYEKILNKIDAEMPSESEGYKDEAVIKLLSTIAGLYCADRQPHRFLLLCCKAIFDDSHWILQRHLWQNLFRLLKQKQRVRSRGTLRRTNGGQLPT